MSTVRRVFVAIPLLLSMSPALLNACTPPPAKGTQIGALREPDPDPAPPSDLQQLDLKAAVEQALYMGGITTLASA
jgi:hypothetical protein